MTAIWKGFPDLHPGPCWELMGEGGDVSATAGDEFRPVGAQPLVSAVLLGTGPDKVSGMRSDGLAPSNG